ncbi:rhodanese-like domain-containing protein [Prosthecobacter sp. SYSU 5D2]|uniref:rhodanese-like domain-containing protein n=1 Tax=Prosthecobacter sp. SYSU 5D2 TaxID=3134134 RepID=UPI0031FE56B1
MQPVELPLEIGVDDTQYLLERPGAPKPRLVDCREEDEWQICRIHGAELVPLSQFGELAPLRFSDPLEHVIVYCHHGMRSQRAALMLRQLGLTQAQSMRGGIDAWADLVEPEMARY